MLDQQQYQENLLHMKNPNYDGNVQSLTSKIEVNQMPVVNFDSSSTTSVTKATQFVFQNQRTADVDSNYTFKSKGKYTNQYANNAIRRNESMETFKFNDTEENLCPIHKAFNDIIVTEPFERFKKHEAICRYCESDYYRLRKEAGFFNKEGCILSTDVITDNTEKILNIRSGKLSITNMSDTAKCNAMLYEEIMPLADELIDIVNDFNEDIISKFDGSSGDNEELLKIKSFIDHIPLDKGVQPRVHGIEHDKMLKIKYVKLAIFLLNFQKINSNVDYSNVSYRLKENVTRMVSLRKCIVVKITQWLKFLLGDYYEFIFRAEGLQVDEDFRRSVKVDFFSEEEFKKITHLFETELSKRDARIRLLEEENERYKRELDALRGNLSYMSDQEGELNQHRMLYQKLEADWNSQKNQIANLTSENQRLLVQNSDYFKEINALRNDIETMKYNFENTLKNTINELRMQYEVQITKISEDYNDLKNKYQSDAKQWVSEREALNGRNQLLVVEMKGYNETISTQHSEINNLNGLLQRTRQEFNVIMQERDQHLGTIESLKSEIRNYQTNLGNLNNQLSSVLKARDDSSLQVENLNRENANLKSTIIQMANELQICNQKIDMYINNLNGISKEHDELQKQLIILRGNLEKKNAELQTLTNIRVSLENRINHLESEISRITEAYTKLQYEFNQKLVIIGDFEKKARELEGLSFSQQNQNEMYITSIQKYENLLRQVNEDHTQKTNQLEKIINELRDRERELTMLLNERDNEISRLKMTISACKEDWNKLSESYESLLNDVKNQININEVLRNLVFELLNKIEMHNQNVNGLDMAIKQQIEVLTRQSLTKKVIDIERNYNQDLSQASNNIDGLRQKLGKIESQKLNKSAVFNTLNFSVENYKQGSNSSVEEISQRLVKNSINKTGAVSGINVDIRKYIDNAGFNAKEFTQQRNTDISRTSESVVREVNTNVVQTPIRNFNTTTLVDATTTNDFNLNNQNRTVFDTTDVLNNTVVLRSENQ